MYVIDLLLLQMIVVFIIDCSGITNTIKKALSKFLTKGQIESDTYHLPLIGCSLCVTFWIGLVYLLITNQFSIPLFALVCLLSFFTPITKDLLLSIRDLLIKLVNKLC